MNGPGESGIETRPKKRHPMYLPYMRAVIGLGTLSILYAFWHLFSHGTSYQWLILAALTVVTGTFSIKIPAVNSKISIGDTLFFTNVVLFGPAAGILTAALDALVGSLRSRTSSRRLQYMCFNVGAISISALVGGTAFFWLLGREPLYYRSLGTGYEIVFPLGVLAFLHYFFNSGSVAIIVALEVRKNIVKIWHDSFLWTSITYFAGAAAAGLVSVSAGSITPQVIAVAMPVVLAVYYTYKTYLNKVQEVRSLAYYDSLTLLPNRVLFKEYLSQEIESALPEGKNLALMFLDLDNFKRINDTYGHCIGDLLVRGVAERLAASVRMEQRGGRYSAHDQRIIIGRFGGDEFTVLMRDLKDSQDAARVADRLLKTLADPFALEGHEVSIGASLGISIFPFDGMDADTLLKNADAAMFHAKANERSSYYFFSQSMTQMSPEKLSMENELRKALGRGEFRVHYQPKVDARTGILTGAEALLRWQHPTRGLLAAAEFISLAEETGLIRPIGEWTLRTACAQIADWQNAGLSPVPVAVNLSALQFRQHNLAQSISRIMQEAGVEAKHLELEITEGAIIQDEDEADRSLRALRELGIKISIDDFGTGYSSLSRLRRFTLDALKIDRSFVTDLAANPDDKAIITAIIAMAGSLKLRVIAEGVETGNQLRFLEEQGCDEIQGYLCDKPMPADEFAELLEDRLRYQPLFAARRDHVAGAVASGELPPGQGWVGGRRGSHLRLVSKRDTRSLTAANS